jgi:hypothetical protein
LISPVIAFGGSRQIGDWPLAHYTFPKTRLFFIEVDGKQYAVVGESLDMAIASCEDLVRDRHSIVPWLKFPEFAVRITG